MTRNGPYEYDSYVARVYDGRPLGVCPECRSGWVFQRPVKTKLNILRAITTMHSRSPPSDFAKCSNCEIGFGLHTDKSAADSFLEEWDNEVDSFSEDSIDDLNRPNSFMRNIISSDRKHCSEKCPECGESELYEHRSTESEITLLGLVKKKMTYPSHETNPYYRGCDNCGYFKPISVDN